MMIDWKIRNAFEHLSLRSEQWAPTIADAYIQAEALARMLSFELASMRYEAVSPRVSWTLAEFVAEVKAELEKP